PRCSACQIAAPGRALPPRPGLFRRHPEVTLARRPRPCHTATIIDRDVGRVARTPPRREGGGIRVSALAARVIVARVIVARAMVARAMVARAMVACAVVLLLACSSTPARESAPAQSGPAPAAGAAAGPAGEAAGAGAAAPEPRKVRMAYGFAAVAALPMYIAQDQGIYRKYGLDVESILMQTSAQIAPAMAAGEIDVALTAGAGVGDVTLSGADQVLIESDSNVLRFYLHSRPDIRRVEDLRDKRVAITRLGSGVHLATQIVLNKAGLEAGRDVQILQAGTVDAGLTAL